MGVVTEHFHEKRLKDFHINIKTKFQDGSRICERNSDNSYNDDIKNGIILNKTYFKDGNPVFAENDFNPSILYSLVMNGQLESELNCPNCGMNGKGKDFINGCPYCGSIYTIEYTNKNTGAKNNIDYIAKDNKYKIRTLMVDIAICLAISTVYCLSTGRTFTPFDLLKILGIASVGTLLLYFPFHTIDSYMVNSRVKKEKEEKFQKQTQFWNNISKYNISKTKFFNNLNNELNEYYFDNTVEKNKNVIDYDVLDYDEYSFFKDNKDKININVKMEVRTVEDVDGKLISNNRKLDLILVQNDISEDQYRPGIYVVKCRGCGASIDIMKEKCDHCGAKINYLQSWYISKI